MCSARQSCPLREVVKEAFILQNERQEGERRVAALQEQIRQLQEEARNAAAESSAALEEAARKAHEERQALQVSCCHTWYQSTANHWMCPFVSLKAGWQKPIAASWRPSLQILLVRDALRGGLFCAAIPG